MAIEKRAAAQAPKLDDGDVMLQFHADDGLGFKIHVVGYITMRVRYASLSIASFAKIVDVAVYRCLS